jgi:hypothetical protein
MNYTIPNSVIICNTKSRLSQGSPIIKNGEFYVFDLIQEFNGGESLMVPNLK